MTGEQRDLVRRGYDTITDAYRDDGGGPDEERAKYLAWVDEIAGLAPAGGRVVDLGCGCGVPATKALVDRGFDVVGVDFSAAQLDRARRLVPGATFVEADLADFDLADSTIDAVVSYYALIHVPLDDQRPLFTRLARWLRSGGYAQLIVGAEPWTGTEDYFGAPMFWDHAGTGDYVRWLSEAGMETVRLEFVPEGDSGHTLVLARRP